MRTINIDVASPTGLLEPLALGIRGENEVTQIRADYSAWAAELGTGTLELYIRRRGDAAPYPKYMQTDGSTAVWTVDRTDTDAAGKGIAQFAYLVDGKVKKTSAFWFEVQRDLGFPAGEAPDPYDSWVEQLTQLGAQTQQAAADAAEDAVRAHTEADAAADARDLAEQSAAAAVNAAETAGAAAQTAETGASDAEAWAVGTRGGQAVQRGDPTYLNNSRFFADVAQQGAEQSGWAFFDVNAQTGYLEVTVSADFPGGTNFEVNESNGTLEVTVS